jgi:hypothetical protein
MLSSVVTVSKERKYKDQNRRYEKEWEEEFVFAERYQIKYFVLKTLGNFRDPHQ